LKALKLLNERSLALVEEPVRPVSPGRVRVRVAWVALNHLDLFGYNGMTFSRRRLPITVGIEASGVVAEVGEGVDPRYVDKAVVIFPADLCESCYACLGGEESLCEQPRGILGFHLDGVCAEFVDVRPSQIIFVPDGVDLKHAACAPVTFSTVVHMLVENADLRKDDVVLVHAGGSGIGSSAIQICKYYGAKSLVTVGSDEKAEKARRLDVDLVINRNATSFSRASRKYTKKRGVDIVFEHIGATTFQESIDSLRKGGTLVICGSSSGVEAKVNLISLFNRQIHIKASFGGTRKHIKKALDLMAKGVEPLVDSVRTMGDFREALSLLERQEVFGKILLEL